MENFSLISGFILENIRSAPFTAKLALLSLLVALISIWVSFKALNAAEQKKTVADPLAGVNQKTVLLSLLQEIQISTLNAKKELKLTDFFIAHLNSLLESNAQNSRDKIIIKIDETLGSLDNLNESILDIDQRTQEIFAKIEAQKGAKNPDKFEQMFPGVRALRNEAQIRVSTAVVLHAEIKGYYDLILNEHLVLNIHRSTAPPT